MTSVNLETALATGLVVLGEGAIIAPTARFVALEDDGQSSGPIHIGSGVRVRDGVTICSGVQIGERTIIGTNCVIRARVRIGIETVVSHFVCIERDKVVGDRVRISALTHLTGSMRIGDEAQIGARVVTVNDAEMNWHGDFTLRAPTVERRARVGSGVTLMAGVTIGEGAFIGAGSLVLRDIPSNTLAFGHPASVRKELEKSDV